MKQRVLVTGSAGLIGNVLSGYLADEFELRGFDRRTGGIPGTRADLLDEDAIVAACRGVEAVVHLAGESRVEAGWPAIMTSNIQGTVNVFEAARMTGVRRVVVASSNHVVGGFEREHAPELYALDDERTIGVDDPIRPDSPYGVSKAFAETLGRFAHEEYGLTVACLRLGSVVYPDDAWGAARAAGGSGEEVLRRFYRYRATWLSHRDCADLVRAALRADLGFAIVYGVSANSRRLWDLEPGRRLLGWWPADSAPIHPPP